MIEPSRPAAAEMTVRDEPVRAFLMRARALSFDTWLFVLMLVFVSLAVGSSLYVSYTSLRYVAEVIGGMPGNVSAVFPLTIDASVAAGLLGEWWLSGRRNRSGLAFVYMLIFGVVFALLTIAGNAAHGALALTVQRPVELHIGGALVPMPWWISIGVSAVPGLAIGGSGFAVSLVVAAWRRERIGTADALLLGAEPARAGAPIPERTPEPAAVPEPRSEAEEEAEPTPEPGPIRARNSERNGRAPEPSSPPRNRRAEPGPEPAPVRPSAPAPNGSGPVPVLDRALLLLQERPELSGSELGRQLGVSDAYGRRLLRDLRNRPRPVETPRQQEMPHVGAAPPPPGTREPVSSAPAPDGRLSLGGAA